MRKEFKFEVDKERGKVSAILSQPANAKILLVVAHGAGTDMRHFFLENLCELLAEKSIATMRYNFPYKEKGGKGGPNGPKILTATIVAAIEKAKELAPQLNLFAGGKSMGGRMTSQTESAAPLGVQGLVFFGFPLHPPGKPGIERADHLKQVAVPMLFLQGPRDTLAKPELMQPVIKGLGSKAQIHMVDGADHSFKVLKRSERNEEEVLEELAGVSSDWMKSKQ
jgi:hypothetical protein